MRNSYLKMSNVHILICIVKHTLCNKVVMPHLKCYSETEFSMALGQIDHILLPLDEFIHQCLYDD